jgi:glycosyltransferase involved in cell wall biosynthesis
MPGVHQVVAGAAPHDAITNHVLAARSVIRSMGIASEVFCEAPHLSPALAHEIHSHHEWGARTAANDAAILHYSIDSQAFEYVLERCATSAIHYHNITPARSLWRFNPRLARQCAHGRTALAALAGRIDFAAADSRFNGVELEALGFPHVSVIGILRSVRPTVTRTARGSGRPQILFVGRGVPNKAQDDAILAVAALRQAGVLADLRLVGSWGGNEAFEWYCRDLVRSLDLAGQVHFLGAIDDGQLSQEYADADLFLCLSDHEGFCVPVVEALEAGLPVIAYGAGALPETLGGAGVVLTEKPPGIVAEAIASVLKPGVNLVPADAVEGQVLLHSRDATTARLRSFVSEMGA